MKPWPKHDLVRFFESSAANTREAALSQDDFDECKRLNSYGLELASHVYFIKANYKDFDAADLIQLLKHARGRVAKLESELPALCEADDRNAWLELRGRYHAARVVLGVLSDLSEKFDKRSDSQESIGEQ